jgi:hypothetical protein
LTRNQADRSSKTLVARTRAPQLTSHAC